MCKTRDETVTHIISECSKLAQTNYKARHDRVASAVQWSIMKGYGLPHTKSWYDHRADKVVESKDVKSIVGLNIQVDKFIEARWPDIISVRKKKSVSSLILLSLVILEPR